LQGAIMKPGHVNWFVHTDILSSKQLTHPEEIDFCMFSSHACTISWI
jgi:hypothetical protein